MKAEDFYNKWQLQDIELKSIEPCQFTKEELLNFGKQYAELRIQQEREKWKEEVKNQTIKAWLDGDRAPWMPKLSAIDQAIEYYETQVKPRIESK